jgi:hypothetical protein
LRGQSRRAEIEARRRPTRSGRRQFVIVSGWLAVAIVVPLALRRVIVSVAAADVRLVEDGIERESCFLE